MSSLECEATNISWSHAPTELEFRNSEVQLWLVNLSQNDKSSDDDFELLSEDEQQRAKKYFYHKDQQRFTIIRSTLRKILGRYLKCSPRELKFSYGQWGKPELLQESFLNDQKICFNQSHSGDLCLFAFGLNCRIGIDIEKILSMSDIDELADRFFTAKEAAILRTFSGDKKLRIFFNCWTRKEAFVKALGRGLSYSVDQFEVSIVPGEPVEVKNIQNSEHAAIQWSMYDVAMGTNYAAALCVEGKVLNFQWWKGI